LARAALGTLTLFAALVPAAAFADLTPGPTSTPAGEIGRVSTSDRHDEPIERTTRSTFVVDRARIEARGERTIADAVADVPGVEIYRYGAFGSQAVVLIRGGSSQNVLIFVDGDPVTPGSNEQLDLGETQSRSALVVSVRARNTGNERYQPLLGYQAPARTIEFEVSTR
jgi:outer membrane cobalamin receptor